MPENTVTQLTTAFNATGLLTHFIAMAPYILGVAGLVIMVSLIKWGVRKVRSSLGKGVA